MRHLFSVVCAWLLVVAVGPSVVLTADDNNSASDDIFAAGKRLGRGINLGNALDAPNEGEWGVTLKSEYFQAIKEAGFDTVRLPVKWSNHAQIVAPYTIDSKFATRVDWAIDQALANKLNIIVNIHHFDQMDAAPDDNLPRLVALWEQIAERYKDRPTSVYFELFNEPHENFTEAKWNAAIPKLLAKVRKTNPTRAVIVGPGQWNAIWALPKLELPDDEHLILTFHYYDPFEFTHQGAPWAPETAKFKGRRWTGSEDEQTKVRKSFGEVARWAKDHRRPVLLGEFGAYQEADMESRARWSGFIAREAEKNGFSWAYWEFCSGFGAYDPQKNVWRDALKTALVPK